jgi:prepilin-type N-terminal cleavage/methylation domain-containing protein
MSTEHKKDLNADRVQRPAEIKQVKCFALQSSIRLAFTLAEVLITLTIIGVVAALTIPSLINNYQEKALLTQFQETYTSLQQAYIMASAEDGTADTWADTAAVYTNLKPYLKLIQDCPATCHTAYPAPPKNLVDDNTTWWYDYYHVMLANGATLKFVSGAGYRGAIVDTNGNKSPNRIGYDVFTLHFSKKSDAPFLSWPDYTADGSSWVEGSSYSCNKSSAATDGDNGYGCTYWIIKNWNMDYLHRDLSNAEWVQ